MKDQKGITLIALVITIIVLLILAGISIAMLTSNDGLLTRATDSVDKDTIAREKERVMLDYNAAKEAWYEAKYAPAKESERTTDNFDKWIKTNGANYFKDGDYYTVDSTYAEETGMQVKLKSDATIKGTIKDTGITWSDAE